MDENAALSSTKYCESQKPAICQRQFRIGMCRTVEARSLRGAKADWSRGSDRFLGAKAEERAVRRGARVGAAAKERACRAVVIDRLCLARAPLLQARRFQIGRGDDRRGTIA